MPKRPLILLAEDEANASHFIQAAFKRMGMNVLTTASGKEMISLTRDHKPDVILLDFLLKEMDGLACLAAIRKFDANVKVLLVTGCNFNAHQQKQLDKMNIAVQLRKPVGLMDLIHKVELLINNKQTPTIRKDSNMPNNQEKNTSRNGSPQHQLANLLGIIRNKCENFAWNIDDNITNGKNDKELLADAVAIMKDIIQTVDDTADIVEKL